MKLLIITFYFNLIDSLDYNCLLQSMFALTFHYSKLHSYIFITSVTKVGYVLVVLVCLLMSYIARQVMNGLQWNFKEESSVVTERTD